MLADLIRNNKIEFHSYGRKLDNYPCDFGEYNKSLVEYLTAYSGNCMSIRGDGLEDYLGDVKNLYSLTEFLVQLWSSNINKKRYDNMGFHVDADIEKIDKHYKQPAKDSICNGFGQKVCDVGSWVSEIPYFEKVWNFALCSSVGGMIGYPGYEHPLDDASFRYEMREHATNFMIGTKEQLKRYRPYAKEYLKTALAIARKIRKNPDFIFKDPFVLAEMEIAVRNAKHIASNLQAFEDM